MTDGVLNIKGWFFIGVASILVHIFLLSSFKKISESELARLRARAPVVITMNSVKKVEATPVPTAVPTPKPTVRPKAPQKQLITKASNKPKEELKIVPEVHGLSAKSFAPSDAVSGATTTAVAGNSTMVGDSGLRKAPEEIVPLPKNEAPIDLSETAHLDLSTLVRPEYTKEALKVRLKGDFPVDVHVSATGEVLEVEFPRPVGFGMQERIKQALLTARFFPEREKSGRAAETWVTVQFRLEMP